MRMSASSSTIRMSCAMSNRTQLQRLGGGVRTFRRAGLGGEDQPDPRPLRFPIFQHQLSPVIFHDLLDDGEAQTRPLRPRRYIGLGQSLTALARQAFAVVLDD